MISSLSFLFALSFSSSVVTKLSITPPTDSTNLLAPPENNLFNIPITISFIYIFFKPAKVCIRSTSLPLCGDIVHVYLKLSEQRKVEDISFEGSGCAISMASASIMTDLIKGKSDNETKEIIEDFLGMIKENPELKSNILKEDDKTKLMCLSGVKQYPMRVKCATLSWHTLISAMENDGKEISTES